MSNKKHTKILLCRFNYPMVDELAEWNEEYLNHGHKVVKTLNDTIVNPKGEFDNEFWFIKTKVRGETKIIAATNQHDWPANYPPILEKLEAYLNPPESYIKGFPKHGLSRPKITPDLNPTIVKRKAKSAELAVQLADKLAVKLGDRAEIQTGVEGGGHYVEIISYTLTQREIFEVIEEIKSPPGS